jgi:HK97 family phage major capsid protein
MFINGVGTGLEPAGILSYSLTTFDVEGSTANNISNSVSNAGSAPKIIAGAYTLPAQYAERATWLMSRQSQGEIHGLVDADGRPWWQLNAGAGGAAGAPPTLVNIPVRTSPFMPIDNTDTNKVLLLGDFSAYIIADRTSMTVQVDPINGIGTDETSIYIRSRAGGGLWNTDAFRVGVV